MSSTKCYRVFQKAAWSVFITYCGLMVYVIIIAYQRQSGVTGMDPAKMVQIRHKFNEEQAQRALALSMEEET